MTTKFSELQDKFLVLSNLKEGEKLCVKSWTCVEKGSLYGAIYRKWNGETRTLTLQVLERMLTKAQKYIRQMSVDQLFPVHVLLKSSSDGLNNLTMSYKSDPDMCSKLEALSYKLLQLQKLVQIRTELLASVPHLTPVSPRPLTMGKDFDLGSMSQQDEKNSGADSLIQSEIYYSVI